MGWTALGITATGSRGQHLAGQRFASPGERNRECDRDHRRTGIRVRNRRQRIGGVLGLELQQRARKWHVRQPSGPPVLVAGVSTAVEVAVETDFACALLASHDVEWWVYKQRGQLGEGTTNAGTTPVTVHGLA